MSSRRSAAAVVVAAATAWAGCTGRTDPPKPAVADDARAAPAGPPRVVQVAPPGAAVIAQPVIELPRLEAFQLLDPGTGVRAPLRYRLAGAASFVAATTIASRHLAQGAFTPPVTLPVIHDGFAITVGDTPGRVAVRALPGEAQASPDADAYLAAWRQLLQNRRMTIAIDDRGQLGTVRFNDDPTGARSEPARHEAVQRLLAAIVPLPAEPIGVGARWRVVTILRQGPAYAKQTATYTLVARGPVWKLHVAIKRVAEEQPLDDPALPRGATAELLAMLRTLEGDVEVDPTQPLLTGTLALESRLHVQLTPPGAPAASEQIFEDTGTMTWSRRP